MKDDIEILDFMNQINNEIKESAAVLQKIELPNSNNNISIFLKREDLLHPTISGNKWRKLKYNLIEARKQEKNTLLTFGGAYSNHIHAMASAGKIFGFKSIGIIRGEEHIPLNPTLTFAKQCGMEIHYIDRTSYRLKKNENFIEDLYEKFGELYLIPEGGTNNHAIKGCSEIVNQFNIEFNYILSACGTGGTISGLICGLNGNKNIIGIPVLKGADFLISDISNHVLEYSKREYSNWKLNMNFHIGGYAKINKELIQFMDDFKKINNITLDPIYTGKLLFAINSMISEGEFDENSTIIALHTGGLQGIAGMKNKMDKLLS